MKSWKKLTAILLAVVIMLCACDPYTNTVDPDTNTPEDKPTVTITGQLLLSGGLHWGSDYADVFIDGTKVGTFKEEQVKFQVAPGSHELELKAYAGDNLEPVYTYKKTIEITALKNTSILIQPYDWNDTSGQGTFTYNFPRYLDADIYDVKFDGKEPELGGRGFSSLNSYRPTKMKPGTYEVKTYAYKEGKLVATATPADLVIEDGKNVECTFPVEDWKEYTGPSSEVSITLRAETTPESDSVALFLNDEYACNENAGRKYMLDNSLVYSTEIFGFKNGNPVEHSTSRLTPHRDMTHVYRPFSKWCSLSIETIPYDGATSYTYTLDGKPFYDSLDNIQLIPGDHHFEIHALNGDEVLASKYFDFNINNHENKEITMDSWEKPLDVETITSVVESFDTASWGWNRVYDYPINRLSQEQVTVLEGALNTNISALLDGAEIIDAIKCTVENGTFTATLKFKVTNETVTMTVEQSPLGALRITRVNEMDNGTTYTDHTSYALLDNYSFKYAKNISDNVTFVDNVTWEGSNQTETIVAAKIRNKEELRKLLIVNGFEPTGTDWDVYDCGDKYKKDTDGGCYRIWITKKHDDGSYSVSIRELNRN